MGIIYKATLPNGKSYVGFTKKELEKRKIEHFKSSKNGSNSLFHKAIRKYGFDKIEWKILKIDDDNFMLLNFYEGFYIKEEKTHFMENGYNMTWGGEAGSNKQWRMNLSEEDWENHVEQLKFNLSKSWKSEKRKNAMKESWENEQRRKDASSRMKNIWASRDKTQISNKISTSLKKSFKEGSIKVKKEHLTLITEKAKIAVKGSKWYNDGVRNYRLFDSDTRIIKLNRGKI